MAGAAQKDSQHEKDQAEQQGQALGPSLVGWQVFLSWFCQQERIMPLFCGYMM
jgi:hypothetical protein